MSGAALTLAAVAALIVDPACGGVRVDTAEGAALRDRLLAKFRQESGLRGTDLVHPYTIRDETEGRGVSPVPRFHAGAVAEANRRLALGHVLGLGLGQITWADNLKRDFRVATVAEAVPLAFVPCHAVAATVRHYSADISHVLRVMDCASVGYNAGRARIPALGCDTRYVRAVRALQAAIPADMRDAAGRAARTSDAPLDRAGMRSVPRPVASADGGAFVPSGGAFVPSGGAFVRPLRGVVLESRPAQETAP